MRDRDTFSIGCVGFAEPSTKNSAGFQGTHHIGDERVRLLQLVRDGKPLPDPLFLIASHGSGGWRRITPEEIDWETSGIEPSLRGSFEKRGEDVHLTFKPSVKKA